MKRLNLKHLLAIIGVGTIIFGFQNCSNVSFDKVGDPMGKAVGSYGDSADLGDGDIPDDPSDYQDDFPDPTPTPSATPIVDPTPTPPAGESPTPAPTVTPKPGDDDDDDFNDNDDPQFAELNASCGRFHKMLPQALVANPSDVTLIDSHGPVLIPAAKLLIVENSNGPKYFGQVDEVVRVRRAHGPLFIATQSAREMTDMAGPTCLLGRKLNNVIGEGGVLTEHRGPLMISNLNFEKIADVHGPLKIVGGKVKLLSGARGPIILMGVRVETLTDARGPIVLKGGSTIGSMTNVRGPIVTEP